MSDELKEELEELVAEQKDRARRYETFTDPHMEGLSKGYRQCANQLQEIIESMGEK